MKVLGKSFFHISFIALITTMSAQSSFAQNLVTSEKVNGDAGSFSLGLTVETNSNLYKENTYERQTENSYNMSPSLRFSETLRLDSHLTLVQKLTGDKNTTLLNTPLSLVLSGFQLGKAQIKYKALAYLPTDTESNRKDSFRGSVGFGGDIAYRFNQRRLPTDLLYAVSVKINNHEFNINSSGAHNIQGTVSNTFGVSSQLLEKTSLALFGTYTMGRTYQGSPRYLFSASATLQQSLTDNFTIHGGTGNQGPALKYNGIDSNISFFDENHSIIFAGLNYQFQ